MVAEHASEGRVVAIRDAGRGSSASADDHRDGRISMDVRGSPAQGEDDTLEVCHILIRAMEQQGEHWSTPRPGEQDVDCIATSAMDPCRDPLCIQVVRAIEDRDVWSAMAKSGRLTFSHTAIDDICKLLAKAVQKKINGIPPRQRPELVLALDANRLPALLFDSVVETFRNEYRTTLITSGFASIWIVGPSESLTRRLDLAQSP